MPLSKDEIKNTLDRQSKMERARGTWDAHWQQLAEIFLPRRASFTRAISEGQQLNTKIYDSAPMLARRGLSSAIDGLLKPKTTKWFHIRPVEDALGDDDEAKIWIEDAEKRLWRAIYNPKARFIERTGEVDDDVVTFGTGCIFVGTSTDNSRLLFKSYHLKRVYIQEDSDGLVDTVHVVLSYSARQAAQKWGARNLGEKVQEALKKGNDQDKPFDFIWCVKPRQERDYSRRDNANFPFASYVIGKDDENIVEETGYYEFPFAVPRWDTSTEEMYGRSPAMLALPDGNTLQAIGKTLLVAGQRAVDPPLMAASDSVVGIIRTYPGGITHYDAEAVGLGNRDPVKAMETGAKIPLGREMQNDIRDQLWIAFFRDVLRLPTWEKGNPKTATEILERKDEFLRVIGPVFGRLEGDYIAPIIERCFNIMWRARQFLPLPESLAQTGIKFEYASPVEQARKQIEAAGAARAYELITPLAQVQPEIIDNFDGDAMTRDIPDTFGVPMKWLRTREDVAQIRAGRAQQAARQQRDMMLLEAAKVAPGVAKGVETVTNMGRQVP